MQNFNNMWQNFLNESSRTENVPFEETRFRVKLENKEKFLREVTEDEFEHIQQAIDELSPEDLAFNDIFEGKTRLIIDFPTIDEGSELGRFVNMWKMMGYKVDWAKGIVTGERTLRDTSPEAMAAELSGGQHATVTKKQRTVTMKIGKWLSKLYDYLVKSHKLDLEIYKYMTEHGAGVPPAGEVRSARGMTGNDIQDALGDEGAKKYYKLQDLALMMNQYMEHGLGKINMGAYQGAKSAEKVKELIRYWQLHADYIKKNLDDAVSSQYSIIITRDPIDIWRMSDFDNIESCHSPPSRGGGGEYYKCAVAEAHGHGAVAYVVKTEELLTVTGADNIDSAEQEIQEGEIFADTTRRFDEGELEPVSRLRLRQVRYYEHNKKPEEYEGRNPFAGTQLAVPESRIYGTSIPGFYDRMVEWTRERQQTQIENAPRNEDNKLMLDDFIKFGGSHDDNPMSILIPALFGITTNDITGYVKTNTDTQDELDVNLIGGLMERYQSEVDVADEEFNQMMAAATVNGTVVDDGADGVYITCEAELLIKWNADEWKGMPGVDVISYALEELKEYGLGWVKSDYPYVINKLYETWLMTIDIEPGGLVGFSGEGYAYDPDNYREFCHIIDQEVDEKREMVKAILTTFFKREGFMSGGAIIKLGRDVENDQLDLYHWEAETEEGYEIDEFELVIFTAHPEVWYKDLGATEEQAMKIMNDRNFWLEIRNRMVAPAFENTGGQMYPQIPLDMDMFGTDGTEDESQELNLYFSVHDDAPDEQVEVLRNLVEIWDDQDEINRVANEVFRDMLTGSIKSDGDQIPGSPSLKEELNALKIERMLERLII